MQTLTNTPAVFSFDSHAVRTLLVDDAPWFVAADVIAALTLDRKALERLDDDEKGVNSIHTLGGQQEMGIINESGLYNLVLGSRKPEAKRFKKWVTSEVLPAIRKSGRYESQAPARPDSPISEDPHGVLRQLILDRFFRGTDLGPSNAALRRHFQIKTLRELPASRFIEALKFVLARPASKPVIPRPKKPAAAALPSPAPAAQKSPDTALLSSLGPFRPLKVSPGDEALWLLVASPTGEESRWIIVVKSGGQISGERLTKDSTIYDPAELPEMIREPAGLVSRALLPAIVEACVARLSASVRYLPAEAHTGTM